MSGAGGPPYRAVMFDLLTALLDSWSLWNDIAGSAAAGFAWRAKYLEVTYEAGAYRDYGAIIHESAERAGMPSALADALIARWDELVPWPETGEVLRSLAAKVPIAVATNASIAMGRVAAQAVDVPIDVLVTAEDAGFYKPRPEPYLMALDRLGLPAAQVLFVAGSAADVPGAMGVGMDVYWHNRRGLAPIAGTTGPSFMETSLLRLAHLV